MKGIPKHLGRVVWANPPRLVNVMPEALHTIQHGVTSDHVEFVSDKEAGNTKQVQFDFLGFRYEIDCDYIAGDRPMLCVMEIEKIARVDEPDAFSDTYGDHMAIVVEDYRLAREPKASGTW